jgi:hypothetical protein
LNTPDITPVQVTAVLQWLVAFVTAFFAVKLSDAQVGTLMGSSTGLAVVLTWADHKIRKARAENAVSIAQAKAIGAASSDSA